MDDPAVRAYAELVLSMPGLAYYTPLSAQMYEERFPGLPPGAFELLEAYGPRELPAEMQAARAVEGAATPLGAKKPPPSEPFAPRPHA